MKRMLQSIDGLPVNYGFLGKGNCSVRRPLVEQMLAGACGFKIHEDWGSTPAAIRATMAVADEFDVQVAIHTETSERRRICGRYDRCYRWTYDSYLSY